jgi:hypothetical protein
MPCLLATHEGASYVKFTVPSAACQTRAFNGRSIPLTWATSISGVPVVGLPKIKSVVGGSAASPDPSRGRSPSAG